MKNNEYIDDLVLAAKCCIARGEFNESLDYLESATQIIKVRGWGFRWGRILIQF